jgi:hypothetical protein
MELSHKINNRTGFIRRCFLEMGKNNRGDLIDHYIIRRFLKKEKADDKHANTSQDSSENNHSNNSTDSERNNF